MSTMASIALSGLGAARRGLQVSAHNLANLATDGFRRQQAVPITAAGGGVSTAVVRAPAAGHAPEADVVGQLQARNAFLANVAVFKTADRMLGSLLDRSG